jgi:hypothetical protein
MQPLWFFCRRYLSFLLWGLGQKRNAISNQNRVGLSTSDDVAYNSQRWNYDGKLAVIRQKNEKGSSASVYNF